MTAIPIESGADHVSKKQRAVVEDRGAGSSVHFGKITLFRDADLTEPECQFLWVGSGRVSIAGVFTPTQVQNSRAVRALCETEVGRKALGLGDDFDWETLPGYEGETADVPEGYGWVQPKSKRSLLIEDPDLGVVIQVTKLQEDG